jgi:uncharacterized protein YacL
MALWILRAVFLVVAAGVGFVISNQFAAADVKDQYLLRPLAIPSVMLGAVAIIAIDAAVPRKRIEVISSIYLGVLVGLVLAYLFGLAVTPMFSQMENGGATLGVVQILLTVALCYGCISLLIQTKDDFRFIIPYVEFSKEVKGMKPLVLDTSAAIDGRIADVFETGIIDSQVIMPHFILAELQTIADSSDKMRRARGRRGLDVLNRMRNNTKLDFKINETETPQMKDQPVDMKLVLLANHLDAKVVTGDFNLNKVARLHNVPVVNLNELANALRPVLLPGENVAVKIVKQGEEANQGVGYLDDGTMIVVEGGREHVGRDVDIVVTSVLQTSAGRMIFGRTQSTTLPKK